MLLSPTLSKLMRSYYLGPDHPFKLRLLNNFFHLSKARLVVPYAEKAWISVDPTDGVQNCIMMYGYYEPEVWESLAEHLKPNDIFWDVGSNIGSVGIRAALDSRVKEVHCFEPLPPTFHVLEKNISKNPTLAIKAHPLALGESEEDKTIYATKGNIGRSSLVNRAHEKEVTPFPIRCSTADLVIERGIAPAPTIMKIDVEEWEIPMLRGAQNLLKNNPPRALAIEASADAKGNLANSELGGFLEKLGYTPTHIKRRSGVIETVENYLFLRRS